MDFPAAGVRGAPSVAGPGLGQPSRGSADRYNRAPDTGMMSGREGMAVGIIDKWHEARGAILRKEFADVMARMRDANPAARSAFLNNVHQTIDRVIGFYSSASVPGRKAFLQKMRKACLRSWNSGDWPTALGLVISCLNAESRFIPGEDAAYVKLETDRIVKEASELVNRSVSRENPRNEARFLNLGERAH